MPDLSSSDLQTQTASATVPNARRRNLWLPYNQMKTSVDPIEVVATQGVRLTLADGSQLIDGIASWWTACHGYNHPQIETAIVDQVRQMPHVMMGGVVHQPALTLSQRLAAMTLGGDARTFFSDSGSVSVEVALKMAVQFWMNQGHPQRNKFVCFEGAYHGDTTGAMSVCDAEDSMHAHFKGMLLEHFPAPIPQSPSQQAQFVDFLDQHQHRIAGVIVEPLIQMAAGMRFHSAEALGFVADQCQRRHLLVIADEVATGFGRTGTMFGFEQTNFRPDILCLGKALTGGAIAFAATIADESVYAAFHSDDSMKALMHGPTFMGNPIACAAAHASLDLFESQPRLEQVARIESQLQRLHDLKTCPQVVDVRIKGAVAAVQIDRSIDVGAAMDYFRNLGVFIRPIRDVVYLAPAFTIGRDDLDRLIDAVAKYVSAGTSTSAEN